MSEIGKRIITRLEQHVTQQEAQTVNGLAGIGESLAEQVAGKLPPEATERDKIVLALRALFTYSAIVGIQPQEVIREARAANKPLIPKRNEGR